MTLPGTSSLTWLVATATGRRAAEEAVGRVYTESVRYI